MNTEFSDLKKLPSQPDEWWIAGLVRMPGWLKEGDTKPCRLWLGICTSRQWGLDGSDPVRPEQKAPALVMEGFAKHALRAGRLPAEICVWEEPVAEFLYQQFKSAGLPVTVRLGKRPPIVDAILEDMVRFKTSEDASEPVPGLLAGAGVTLDQVKSFAEASVLFCQAAPWRVFDSDEDLLQIDAPAPPPRMRYFAVLGRAGLEFGIAFYEKPEDFLTQRSGECTAKELARRTVIHMSLAEIHEIPCADADLYEDHNLPLFEGKTMLPALISPRAIKRLDRDMLALLEGLMRALAVTGEADLDAGTWKREVTTAAGAMRLELSHVPLDDDTPATPAFSREAMEGAMAEISRLIAEGKATPGELMSFNLRDRKRQAVTPAEQAQEKIYAAWETSGRKAVKLAREALELCPDAADAYNILAREYNSPADAKDWYLKAIAAGERTLGQEAFVRDRGHFWGILETRPYMRALEGLAWCQWKLHDRPAAIASANRILELNPNDNQGMRYGLLSWLLVEKRDRDAAVLLKQYDEESAWWTYGGALLAFRLGGDSQSARQELQRALRTNRHAPAYLAGDKALPLVPPASYSFGDESEAVFCAKEMAPAWQSDPAALAWLKARTAAYYRKKKRK